MVVYTNGLGIKTSGIPAYDSTTGIFTQSTITQYSTLVAGASNAIVSVSPSATAGVPLVSAGSSASPVFGTTVVAGGGTGLATLTAYALLAGGTTSTGVLQQIALGTAGQVLTSNGAGSLASFQTPATGVAWIDVTSSTQTIAVAKGYITDNATQVTYTLPASPAQGDVFEIICGVSGAATAPWKIAQNALQSIQFDGSTTTVGVTGNITARTAYDSCRAVCIVGGASAVWYISSTNSLQVT